MAREINDVSVVRYGQNFLVVEITPTMKTGDVMTEAAAEAACLAKFRYEGRCVKSNPDAMRAMADAKAYCRKLVRGVC